MPGPDSRSSFHENSSTLLQTTATEASKLTHLHLLGWLTVERKRCHPALTPSMADKKWWRVFFFFSITCPYYVQSPPPARESIANWRTVHCTGRQMWEPKKADNRCWNNWYSKNICRDAEIGLSGSPVVKTPCFQGRGHRFNPWSGN